MPPPFFFKVHWHFALLCCVPPYRDCLVSFTVKKAGRGRVEMKEAERQNHQFTHCTLTISMASSVLTQHISPKIVMLGKNPITKKSQGLWRKWRDKHNTQKLLSVTLHKKEKNLIKITTQFYTLNG